MLVAGGPTVGIAGGFLQGAGHSTYTSYYGLATDHVLNIQACHQIAIVKSYTQNRIANFLRLSLQMENM